uniref:Solute carrier family 37 member 3 n=1 Tax=Equus asinus TaxID=9793 RepID=A0A9L0KE76_EQUAS
MGWPNIFQRGTLLSRFSHHHIVVFLLTFFSYSLLHASRKTFSNVKVSISKQWTPSALNKSVELPVEVWNSNHLFPSAEEATLFLGTLDTIFLFSYAVGLFISGIVGDRLNLRWVLSFGMCSSALVYSLAYACLKLVNYSFFFWLPFYLSNNFGWKEAEADKLSIW